MSKLRFGLSGDSFREERVHFSRGGGTLSRGEGVLPKRGYTFREEGVHFSRGEGVLPKRGYTFREERGFCRRGGTLFERRGGTLFERRGGTLFERRGGFAEEGVHFSRGEVVFAKRGYTF